MPNSSPDKVRIIQFQMATDAVTAGQFQITAEIPATASAAEIAAELGTLREAGYHEVAAANKRRLEREHIRKQVLGEKVAAAKAANSQTINYKRVEEARKEIESEIFTLEAEVEADVRALLNAQPVLTGS